MTDEEHYDDYIADQDPSFRSHTDITPDELTTALRSLELLGGEMHLGLQVTNLTVVDQFIMGVEHHILQEYFRTDKTPPETMFLNAQSQMWIFAAYELLRTWRARAKDIIKWAENGGLELKAKSLEEDQGFLHSGRQMRAKQLREVATNPSMIETIKTDLRRAHIPFSRIEHLRVSLAKHEVRGRRNSVAYAPGYPTEPVLEARLVAMLGGRAAETVVLGSASSGAGGDKDSDLAQATLLAARVEAQLGLGSGGLLWRPVDHDSLPDLLTDPDVRACVSKRLDRALQKAQMLLKANHALVLRIADALLDQRQLTQDQLSSLLKEAAAGNGQTADHMSKQGDEVSATA